MKKILILIIGIGLIFGLVGVGTQAYFSDVKSSSGNIFTTGYWEYKINATADAGGSMGPSGEVIVPKGEDRTFTMTPDEGYKIADVLVDGESVRDDGVVIDENGVGTYTFINVTANHTIHAMFALLTWDKSSLEFTWSGISDTGQISSIVKNIGDTAMQGEVDWELHYVASGQAPGPQNDKEENIIARGKIPALVQDGSYNICWPESGQVGPGIYKFKAYQRPGHLGTGTLWSDEIIINSATQVTGTVNVVAASVTLSSIAITTSATKLTYTAGDPLDITGLVVTGTYSDGSIAPIAISVLDVSGFDSSASVTGQVLTITVDGTTATYTVDVVAASVTLSSIAITTSATKLTYTVGDPLDITGLVVTGTYSDGSSASLTISTSDVSGFNSSALVTGQVLTITVDGKTATYTVDVVAGS